MSVRRLAAIQPAAFAFSADNEAWARAQIAKYPAGRQASAVIALLWRAQAQNDYWLPKPAIEQVAHLLGLTYIRVLEIATFYSMFNLEPVGQHFIQLCGTTPCLLRGAEAIKAVCREKIGEQRQISADGKFSWVEVECLGACCNAPMVQINDDYFEDLGPENFRQLLDDLGAGRAVHKGSQIRRAASAPAGGDTSLLDSKLYDGSGIGTWRQRFDDVEETAPVVVLPASALAAQEAVIAAKLATLSKDATPTERADAVGAKPVGLAAPRTAMADDLKRIKGIGPVNEGKLNQLGMFHFDQIAVWNRAEIAWVGTFLAFPGRIDRENWLGQAAELAKGKIPN